jgi:hypothetical protein
MVSSQLKFIMKYVKLSETFLYKLTSSIVFREPRKFKIWDES